MNNTLKSKSLYKLLLIVLKGLPIVMAIGFAISNTIPRINPILNMIAHVFGLLVPQFAFMYLASYIFRFCSYHRIFLHYLVIIQIINVTDWYIGIPMTNDELRYLQYVIGGIFVIIAGYLYIKHRIDMKNPDSAIS